MDTLKLKAEEFIDLDTSEAFKAANAIVAKHAKMLNTLKDRMKRDGIQKIQIRRGRKMKRLVFTIRKTTRVDTSALPDDIKDAYRTEVDVWWKNVDIIDLDEFVEGEEAECRDLPEFGILGFD